MVNYLLTEECIEEAKQEILNSINNKKNILGWSGFDIGDKYIGTCGKNIALTASTLPSTASAMVVYNNKIHMIGGCTHGNQGNTVQVQFHQCYDPADGSVTTVNTNAPKFTTGRAIVYKDKIHLFTSTEHYTYDNTNGWVKLEDIVTMYNMCNVAIANDEIYIPSADGALYKYTDGGSTEYVCDIPFTLVRSCGIAVLDNKIHMFVGNGTGKSGNGKQHYIYDVNTGKFEQSIDMPYSAETNIYCITINNEIHMIGGNIYGGTTDLDTYSDGYDHYKLAENGWVQLPDISEIISSGQITYIGDNIYTLCNTGGLHITTEYSDIMNNVSGYLPSGTKILVEGNSECITNVSKDENDLLVTQNDGYVEFNSSRTGNKLKYCMF